MQKYKNTKYDMPSRKKFGKPYGRLMATSVLTTAIMASSALTAMADVNILNVRTGLHPDKTRIVLEISDRAYYKITYLDNPMEIMIDLQETPSREEVKAMARRAEVIGLLEKLYVEDHDGLVRLHISLRKPATINNSFLLKPDQGLQYRLVFDLVSVTTAEWARQVKLSTPKEAILAPPPIPETTSEVTVEIPDEETPVEIPVETLAEPENIENYDETVTEGGKFTFSGYVEMEGRLFTQSSPYPDPKDWTMSFAMEPLVEYVSDTSNSQFIFRPFGRVDVQDKDRSHFDIRELKWIKTMNRWQVTAGINTVFWGVTESNHLVDILNQDDNLEDIDGEDKLGQPMASVSYNSELGVFSVYLMTYFREMRFPGMKGRLRAPLPVDYSQTQYEAASDKWHTDWAARWTHVIGNVDIGLYHFRGTNREPEFVTGTDRNGNAVLIPRYNLINQTGLDMQVTFEDLLIKFEGIRRAGTGLNYWAMTGGFEYSFYGFAGGDSDISVLAEYLYDDRGQLATTPFENDLFVGMRWAANDVDSTQVLIGAIFDLDTSAKFINFEGSRRIGNNWKISLDTRLFLGIPMSDIIYPQSRDDFIQLRLARYF